jgi:hypothetical protein
MQHGLTSGGLTHSSRVVGSVQLVHAQQFWYNSRSDEQGMGDERMIRLIKRVGLVELGRGELRGILRLSPVLLGTAILVSLLWGSGMAASGALFQSPPESPLATDTPAPAPTDVPTQAPTDAPTFPATSAPTSAPSETPTVGATNPAATATATVVLSPTAESTEPAIPTLTVPPEPSPTPTQGTPSVPPTASPASTIAAATATTDPSQRYPEEDTGLRFDWGMLFDSVALGASYVWLCCGILLLVGIPAVFVALWAASKRRAEQEE